MAKTTTLKNAVKIVRKMKAEGKTVCLVTGCFDAIHIGHIKLFLLAKKHADFLVVGLENDASIKLSKGEDRPIFNFEDRGEVLAELKSVDLIFKIEQVYNFKDDNAEKVHEEIISLIKPNFLVTDPGTDKFWKVKRSRARKIGANLLLYRGTKRSSTTLIAEKIKKEL